MEVPAPDSPIIPPLTMVKGVNVKKPRLTKPPIKNSAQVKQLDALKTIGREAAVLGATVDRKNAREILKMSVNLSVVFRGTRSFR